MNEQPNQEVVEEVVDKMKVEISDNDVDLRLSKAVEMLIKTTGIDTEKLKDKTLEEKFDLLSFYADNLPKTKESTTMGKNEPVIPVPVIASEPPLGRKMKDGRGGEFWLFRPSEWAKTKNKT